MQSQSKADVANQMIHPCFGKRSTVGQLKVQATTAEKKKWYALSNIIYIKFWCCYFSVWGHRRCSYSVNNLIRKYLWWISFLEKVEVEDLWLYQICAPLQVSSEDIAHIYVYPVRYLNKFQLGPSNYSNQFSKYYLYRSYIFKAGD